MKTFSFFQNVPKLKDLGIQNCIAPINIKTLIVSVSFIQRQFIKLIDLSLAYQRTDLTLPLWHFRLQKNGKILHIFIPGLCWCNNKAHKDTLKHTQQMSCSVALFNLSLTSWIHFFWTFLTQIYPVLKRMDLHMGLVRPVTLTSPCLHTKPVSRFFKILF